jgi:hypothetical protein
MSNNYLISLEVCNFDAKKLLIQINKLCDKRTRALIKKTRDL